VNLPVSKQDEIFVREFVTTGEELVAAMRSGIKIGDMAMVDVAKQTLRRPDIQAAIRKLRRELGVKVKITQETIAYDLEEVYQGALESKDWRSCISAKEGQAKVLGLMVTKLEIKDPTDPDEMTTAQLERYIRQQIRIEGPIIDVGPEDSQPEPASEKAG
jgi:hypothetical protein